MHLANAILHNLIQIIDQKKMEVRNVEMNSINPHNWDKVNINPAVVTFDPSRRRARACHCPLNLRRSTSSSMLSAFPEQMPLGV